MINWKKKLRIILNQGQNRRYNHVMLGNNYRMTDISASMGLIQLKKLNSCLKKRMMLQKFMINILEISNKFKYPLFLDM